jgi:hypothetical protein
MANTVKLKRSAVSGKVPTVTDLELGELALNTYDGKAYIKKDDGTESIVEIGAGGSGVKPKILTTARVIDEDIVGVAGENMLSINDVTVADGYEVTVPTGSTWIVVG